jgi:hypothetical protein
MTPDEIETAKLPVWWNNLLSACCSIFCRNLWPTSVPQILSAPRPGARCDHYFVSRDSRLSTSSSRVSSLFIRLSDLEIYQSYLIYSLGWSLHLAIWQYKACISLHPLLYSYIWIWVASHSKSRGIGSAVWHKIRIKRSGHRNPLTAVSNSQFHSSTDFLLAANSELYLRVNAWSYTSIYPKVFLAWCLIDHRISLHGMILSLAQGQL